MEDKKFEEVLRELPRTFRPPVDPRYDEMWTAIEAAHFDAPAKRIEIRRRTLTVLPWLAAAAALFIGIAIGRDTAKTGLPMLQPVVATAPGQTAATNAASDTYRDEITRYL